jgi:hypothetical protein
MSKSLPLQEPPIATKKRGVFVCMRPECVSVALYMKKQCAFVSVRGPVCL